MTTKKHKPVKTSKPIEKTGIMRTATKFEVAAVFDVNDQIPRRWVSDGCPCTAEGPKGEQRFNLGEVAAWLKATGRGTRGRPADVETDDRLLAARIRKETALADRYEFELSILKGDTQNIELQRRHLEECLQHVLGTLVSPPLPENPDPAWMREFHNWHISLRHWLQTNWYTARDHPEKLPAPDPFAEPKAGAGSSDNLGAGLAEVAESLEHFNEPVTSEFWKTRLAQPVTAG